MPTDAPEVLQREDAVEEHEDDAASDPDVCIESVKKVRAIVADHVDFVGLWQTSLVGVFSCYDDMVAEMESIITDRFLPNVEMRKALLAVAESAAHLGEVTDKSDPEEAILGVIAQASPSMTAAPSHYVQVCISMVAALSGIPQDKKMILPESGLDIQALTLDAETSDDAPDDALTVKRSCIVEFPQHVVASTFATESVDFLQKCAAQLNAASVLDRHSSELGSKLPNFEHIFPEGLYIRNLAASELLHAPHRAALPKHSVQPFHFLGSLARVHTALHLSPPAVSNPLTKATIAAAQVVYDRAKLIVSIIAHAHVIQVETGAQQKLSAAALLKRADLVPRVLLQARAGALADILDKSLPAPRLRKLANPPAGRLPPMPDRRPPDRRPPARPRTRQRVPGRRPASPMPAHARHARSDGRACMHPPACSCF